jgi:hypothetical protein
MSKSIAIFLTILLFLVSFNVALARKYFLPEEIIQNSETIENFCPFNFFEIGETEESVCGDGYCENEYCPDDCGYGKRTSASVFDGIGLFFRRLFSL